MSTIKYAVITEYGELYRDESTKEDLLKALQSAVGGYIEAVVPNPPMGIIAWANEDGHGLGLPQNPLAVLVLHALGAPIHPKLGIVGRVAFTSYEEVETTSLSDDQYQLIEDLVRQIKGGEK